MRFRHVKAALAAVAAALALLPAPAGAQVSVQPCTLVPRDGSAGTHLLVGQATALGAVAATIRCGIVENGRMVASFYASMPGSVVVGAWIVQLPPGTYTTCSDTHAYFADGSFASVNRCPA
ncbi:MAG TPA: hypothetical protein VG318_04990 [Actinomycetota bacterium]|nr:hypothetical protein [Actinomycetota bacterium]